MEDDVFCQAPPLQYRDIEAPGTIRLLDIMPGSFDGPILCALRDVSLISAPPFNALSYNWGSSTECTPIICNNSKTEVTYNLFAALRRLRHLQDSRTVWADGLCINQGSIEERNRQVKLMKDIDANASKVTIWLGELDRADQLAAVLFLILDALLAADSVDSEESERQSGFYAVLNKNLDFTPLLRLLQKPWCQRVWVIQEISAGQSTQVFWGKTGEIEWDDLWQISYKIVTSNFITGYGRRLKPLSIRDWTRVYQIGTLREQYQKEAGVETPISATRSNMAYTS
jgi:Heterokaryon incompatibility protein (HET)